MQIAENLKSIFSTLEPFTDSFIPIPPVTFKRGETIFLQGAHPANLYWIISGKVKVSKTNSDGKEMILRIGKKEDVLGFVDVLSHKSHSCSAIALENSKVTVVSQQTFQSIIDSCPSIIHKLLIYVAKDLRTTEAHLMSMAQKNIKERFIELLLELSSSFGETLEDRILINVKLTREEMASMIGTSPESLIRLITELKELGLVEQSGKCLVVDPIKLLRPKISETSIAVGQ